ncbi:hypothetical protein C0Q70_03985 [Pomacea canaliculata]|uniref:Exosome complex component 10 n=1 Tax=Pomacea canaliculata TaxID=400727 RepID=A0A2T7PU95_POMCA|nr:hypothetical protein C0Q70_03985 [Pomacea canaliculata]
MAASTSDSGETPAARMENTEIFPGCSNINEFSQQSLRTVLQATKASNDLPTGDDYDFYSTFDAVRDVLDFEARRTLQLIQTLLRHQNVKGIITGADHPLELDEQFDVLIDSNDQIFERVGNWIDEATGVRKNENKLVVTVVNRPNPAVASWNKKNSSPGNSPATPFRLLASRATQRPQLGFQDKIDNSNRPFMPILRHKPNAFKSLEESMRLPEDVTLEETENIDFIYPHPYQYELDLWQPSPDCLEKVIPQEAKSLADVPLKFIDTSAGLSELSSLLLKEKEIAVDLEHHSYRTFQGFLCLMQISTRDHDYLIDTIALRSEMHILNEVFTNPHITKVFHGADSDIEWLQRDFGIYVVNMFDTGQASRVLNIARFSLAHLLHLYCQVEADKQYQLADWRIRPLPEELVQYARQDTHYLLYIYDCLRNELINRGNEHRNLLQSVYQRSKTICLKVYKKTLYREDSHLELYTRSKKVFNSQQMQALKRLFAWRDVTARLEDESVQYVLPNHMLLQMAEILPRERQGVFACCNPIPPLVRQSQHEIHAIILEAREAPLEQVHQERIPQPSAAQHPRYHLQRCPHDLSHQQSTFCDIPSAQSDILQSSSKVLTNKLSNIKVLDVPSLSAFGTKHEHAQETWAKRVADEVKCSFISPFFMYIPPDNTSLSSEKQTSNTVKPKEKIRQEKEREKKTTAAASNADHQQLTSTSREKDKKKKKKKKEKVVSTSASNSDNAAGSLTTGGRKKKKKKATEVAAENAEENFTPFDYASADKSAMTGDKKKKHVYKDIYNPKWHGGDKKQKKKNKKFGAKQRKSLTFS